jgi:hypothetical protein
VVSGDRIGWRLLPGTPNAGRDLWLGQHSTRLTSVSIVNDVASQYGHAS